MLHDWFRSDASTGTLQIDAIAIGVSIVTVPPEYRMKITLMV